MDTIRASLETDQQRCVVISLPHEPINQVSGVSTTGSLPLSRRDVVDEDATDIVRYRAAFAPLRSLPTDRSLTVTLPFVLSGNDTGFILFR